MRGGTSQYRGVKALGAACTATIGRKFSFCDGEGEGEVDDVPSLIRQVRKRRCGSTTELIFLYKADEALEAAKSRIKTPLQFDQIKQVHISYLSLVSSIVHIFFQTLTPRKEYIAVKC